MIKPIKFDLKLDDGTRLATLDDVEENLTPALFEHFHSGKLTKWLRVRKLEELAENVEALRVKHLEDKNELDVKLFKNLCEIFVSEVSEEDAREAMQDYQPATFEQNSNDDEEIERIKAEFEKQKELLQSRITELENEKNAFVEIGLLRASAEEAFNAAEKCYEDYEYVSAFSLYQQAAAQGHLEGQFKLSEMYRKGDGIDKDTEQANFWLKKSADGNVLAQAKLCFLLIQENQNPTETSDYLHKIAEKGNPVVQLILAMQYIAMGRAIDIKPDMIQGLKWMLKAVEQKNSLPKELEEFSYVFDMLNEMSSADEMLFEFQKGYESEWNVKVDLAVLTEAKEILKEIFTLIRQ